MNGLTVAGGNGFGNGISQLSYPSGLYVDDDQTVYVAEPLNHRIVERKYGATSGQVAAGGNAQGNGAHQLSSPVDVIVDKETDSFIICDYNNQRVVRWPRLRVGTGTGPQAPTASLLARQQPPRSPATFPGCPARKWPRRSTGS